MKAAMNLSRQTLAPHLVRCTAGEGLTWVREILVCTPRQLGRGCASYKCCSE
jgi:hypothetical protein